MNKIFIFLTIFLILFSCSNNSIKIVNNGRLNYWMVIDNFQEQDNEFFKSNGNNEVINLGLQGMYNYLEEISFTANINITSQKINPIIDKYNHGVQVNENNELQFFYKLDDNTENWAVYSAKQKIELNKWYHIVVIYKANSYIKFYINSKLDSIVEIKNSINFRNYYISNYYVGRTERFSGVSFNGIINIDSVKIYNRELSLKEIKILYNLYKYSP